jgi:hypothetical protein
MFGTMYYDLIDLPKQVMFCLNSNWNIIGMSRLIGTADKSADIWRFQNNR